jgi:thiamine biosynthesis lipoprotein
VSDEHVHTAVVMDTTVSIRIVGARDATPAIERAFEWFRRIESVCSRFNGESEVLRLAARAGTRVTASDILFEITRFAIALAEETDGAFDPAVGHRLEALGFDREYRTGERIRSGVTGDDTTFRDVELDVARRTIQLRKPLVLDLGAVAKGFAIDMAARELERYENFVIDAGGDLYVGGLNDRGERWAVGIRHPRDPSAIIETILVSNAAVCTSGDYARTNDRAEHHIIDPRSGASPDSVASVTVVAPLAMVADGLATAAFVLGPERGRELIERHGAEGLIITPSLERFATRDA